MTITFKNASIGKYHISINQDKFCSAYYVQNCVNIGGEFRELKKNYYPTKEKAQTRFNYLVRQAKKGTL